MISTSIPPARNRAWIRPRPAWQRRLRTFVDSTGLTVACMGALLIAAVLFGAPPQ